MNAADWQRSFDEQGYVRFPPRVLRTTGSIVGVLAVAALGGAVMVAGGAAAVVVGLLIMLTCLGLAAAAVGAAVRGDATVRIDGTGIAVGRRAIAWDEITAVEVRTMGPNRYAWLGKWAQTRRVAVRLTPAAAKRIRRPRSAVCFLPPVNGFRARAMADWLDQLRNEHGTRPKPTG